VTVLVAGATGTLGRAVAARLGGHRLLSRRPGPGGVAADLGTGAGVRHLVHVSIVGIDRVPLGYYQEKGQRDFRLLDPSGYYVRLTSSG